MLTLLKSTFHRLLNELNIDTHRYLFKQFNIKNRLTGIIGPRGVGKTTLMLQYIKENLLNAGNVFYFSADNIYFNNNTILEFVTSLYQDEDITIFFIDEIHKYKNWNQELKNLYDSLPSIKIIFSGSSSIDLIRGSYDLSRRATIFNLHGLSLREYINLKTNSSYPVISFDTILKNRTTPSKNSSYNALATIPGMKKYFQEYLKQGYYPFVFEEKDHYYEKISRVIDKTIFEDIANFYNLKTANLQLFKKILIFLASIPPGEINIHNLAKNLHIDSKTVTTYLTILNETGLTRQIYPHQIGNPTLRKPTKIFLNNTTLSHVLATSIGQPVNKGNIRELFFIHSLANANIDIHYSKIGDFNVNNIFFEIGGKNKTREQIKGTTETALLVKDDIFLSNKNEIPLYYFGFLY